MIDVFNYNVEDLIKIKKRYIILGIAFFVIGFVVSLLLLLLHNRSNSTLMCLFCVMSIFIFSFLSLFFLLIKIPPILKMIEIVRKKKNLLKNVYKIEKVDENYFSHNGLTFRKIYAIDKENNDLVFYLLKGFEFEKNKKVEICSSNSIIVTYKTL